MLQHLLQTPTDELTYNDIAALQRVGRILERALENVRDERVNPDSPLYPSEQLAATARTALTEAEIASNR